MSHRPEPRSPRAQTRALATTGLVLFLGGLFMATVFPRGDQAPDSTSATGTEASAPVEKPRTTPVRAVRLRAIGALDPAGDGRENDELAPLAVDNDATTAWRTERYAHFFKPGVGLVLDAGRRVKITRVDLASATPGFVAEIRAGNSRAGPFTRIAAGRIVQESTRFPVPSRSGRYVVVWITKLPDGSSAEVAEVGLRGR